MRQWTSWLGAIAVGMGTGCVDRLIFEGDPSIGLPGDEADSGGVDDEGSDTRTEDDDDGDETDRDEAESSDADTSGNDRETSGDDDDSETSGDDDDDDTGGNDEDESDESSWPEVRLDIGAPRCPGDADCDEIPDAFDPFPRDSELPGRAAPGWIYASTSTTLLAAEILDVGLGPFQVVREFEGLGEDEAIEDIAIDEFGVLYALSDEMLFVCEPHFVECYPWLEVVGFNGAGFAEPGWVEDNGQSLILSSGTGRGVTTIFDRAVAPRAVDLTPAEPSRGDLTMLDGELLITVPSYTSSRDAVLVLAALAGFAPIATVLLPIELGQAHGIAAHGRSLYIFGDSGVVFEYDPREGLETTVTFTDHVFTGAG